MYMYYFIDYNRIWLEVMAGGKAAYTANDTSSKVSPHDTENQIVFVTSTLFAWQVNVAHCPLSRQAWISISRQEVDKPLTPRQWYQIDVFFSHISISLVKNIQKRFEIYNTCILLLWWTLHDDMQLLLIFLFVAELASQLVFTYSLQTNNGN